MKLATTVGSAQRRVNQSITLNMPWVVPNTKGNVNISTDCGGGCKYCKSNAFTLQREARPETISFDSVQ